MASTPQGFRGHRARGRRASAVHLPGLHRATRQPGMVIAVGQGPSAAVMPSAGGIGCVRPRPHAGLDTMTPTPPGAGSTPYYSKRRTSAAGVQSTLSTMAEAKAATPANLRLPLGAELLEEPGRTNERRSNFSTSLNQPVVSQNEGHGAHSPSEPADDALTSARRGQRGGLPQARTTAGATRASPEARHHGPTAAP